MGAGRIPICKKCGRKQSYAITRHETREWAEKQGYCLCVYREVQEEGGE